MALLEGVAMKERNDPTDEQLLRRLQRQPVGPRDPRARRDGYWALRFQGYSHAYACRALRDVPPQCHREKSTLSGEYIDGVDPEDLLFVPKMNVELQTLVVLVRPELTEAVAMTASPRAAEYTIWSEAVPSFGVRIRPSGARTYIVMFRIGGRGRQGKIHLGNPGVVPFDTAKRMARLARFEALAGNDPRPMHKSGALLRRAK
jgi:hypothetical protein